MAQVSGRGGGRAGRIVFWVLFGLAATALTGGLVVVVATTRLFSEPSVSMADTIKRGDRMLADRTATQVRRGDVIVFSDPSAGPGYYVRRVIGLSGDHVVCCDRRGRVTINGEALDEPYLYPGDAASTRPFRVTVPTGRLWLLGDHRSLAFDSRYRGAGAVHIVGRVFAVLRSGNLMMLHTPRVFVADGLAPADRRLPAPVIGAGVSGLGLLALAALGLIGLIRHVIRRRRSSEWNPPPAPITWPATPPAGR